jgi:hypothetical protein
VRILYRSDGTVWIDLREQPWCTELQPQEQEVLAPFAAALPEVLERIDLADGIGFFTLTSSGKWVYDDRPTMFAEYGWCSDVQSPLPW